MEFFNGDGSVMDLLSSVICVSFLGFSIYLLNGLVLNRALLSGTNLLVGALLPAIALTITASIATNFALSLGMIGALSIVRYRTPVRSSYELTLLFLLITIGVVGGVNIYASFLLCTFCGVVSLALFSFFKYRGKDITGQVDGQHPKLTRISATFSASYADLDLKDIEASIDTVNQYKSQAGLNYSKIDYKIAEPAESLETYKRLCNHKDIQDVSLI